MRILAISDIHGMYDKFIELLELVKYNPEEDKLILLGDYVDRGPEPIKVLHKVIELKKYGAIVLTGNHEIMFRDAYMEAIRRDGFHARALHHDNGGQSTWDSFRLCSEDEQEQIIGFLYGLPMIYLQDDYVFVHAGIDPMIGTHDQLTETLLWARKEFIYDDRFPIPNKIVIFGHTPTRHMKGKDEIWHGNGKIGIDCGAVFGGRLACLELPNMRQYLV